MSHELTPTHLTAAQIEGVPHCISVNFLSLRSRELKKGGRVHLTKMKREF